jgi:hypothetical protein
MQRAEFYAAELGLPVIPGFVDENGKQKRPCGPWALVTKDVEEIRAFGGAWNGGLIFTPTGWDIVALDVDMKNGKQGWEDLRALEHAHQALPTTPQWQTPTGGAQFLFRPCAYRIPKSIATLGRRADCPSSGLDVIGLGAMTVLPGSERPEGVVEWVQGLSVENVEIAEVPKWLAELMIEAADGYRTKRERARYNSTSFDSTKLSNDASYADVRAERWLRKAVEGKESDITQAPNGAQEATLNGAAFHLGMKIASLRGRGFSISPVLAEEGRRALIQAGNSMVNHDPLWSWRSWEVEEKVDAALAAGFEQPHAELPADLWPRSALHAPKLRSLSAAARQPESLAQGGAVSGTVNASEPSREVVGTELDDEPEPLLPDLERAASFPLDAFWVRLSVMPPRRLSNAPRPPTPSRGRRSWRR